MGQIFKYYGSKFKCFGVISNVAAPIQASLQNVYKLN